LRLVDTMSDNDEGPTDEQWKEVRGLLKAAVLAGDIPLEGKKMRPKVVFEKFMSEKGSAPFDYSNKRARGKFTRMLQQLRKKHGDGDLRNEDNTTDTKPIQWGRSAAKQFLKRSFRDGTISTSYKKEELQQIWNDHCKDHPAFKRIQYDKEAFSARINRFRDDYMTKVQRCQDDLEAYTAAKKNHPTPEFNSRGEPQWNGSEAQKQLKELIGKGENFGKPKDLWSGNANFMKYSLRSFRDHIYQEKRLQKFKRYVESLKQEKLQALQY
jgi:hypothetical protein